MGIYELRDIGSDIGGDIELNSQGDLKLATSYDTMFNILNFWIRTDYGDYAANYSIGCNIGSFVGEKNSEEVLEDMESQTLDSLVRNVIYPEDLQVKVVPLNNEEVLVATQMRGSYIDPDGNLYTAPGKVLTYTFPYIKGIIDPIVEV